jgi:hypothetical protein
MIICGLELVLKENYISFNRHIFKQDEGTAMGSPCAPPYMNIFMNNLEAPIVEHWKRAGVLLLYKRLIDNILMIIHRTHAQAMQIINKINTANPHICITTAISNAKTHFLDLTLHKGRWY